MTEHTDTAQEAEAEGVQFAREILIPFLVRTQHYFDANNQVDKGTETFSVRMQLEKVLGIHKDWRDDIRVPRPKEG
jgi:hypothetical protein